MLRLIFFVTALHFQGCRSKTVSETKADYVDTNHPNANWTQDRMINLNSYARDLLEYSGKERTQFNEMQKQLNESFAAAGITGDDPLSIYQLKLGPYGECFYEEGLSDYDIWWSSHRDQIKKQVEETAKFIRDFHYGVFGQNKGAFSFREVIICPEKSVGGKMILDGYKLYIGVPYGTFGYKPIPSKSSGKQESLMNLWKDGHPLGIQSQEKGLFGKMLTLFDKREQLRLAMLAMWKIFNPISTTRQALRKIAHQNRDFLTEKIASLSRKSMGLTEGEGERAAKIQWILDQLVDMKAQDIAKYGQTVADLERLSNSTDAEWDLFVKNWRCFVSDQSHHADLENDAMSIAQDNIKRTRVTNDVKAGLVAVVNHHDVSVVLAVGGSGTYSKYIDVEVENEFQVSSRVRAGLVAVSTSDNINIDARFLKSAGKAFKRASFLKTISGIFAGESFCR